MHLLITGEVGVGKTTLIKKLLEKIPEDKLYGFYTQKISPDGKWGKTGDIYIFPAPYEEDPKKTHCVAEILGNHQFNLHMEAFEKYGVSLLENIPDGSYVLMDELGFLESKASKFCQKVIELLDRKVCVIGVIKPTHTEFLDKIRSHEKVALYHITEDNRDQLAEDLLQILEKEQSKPNLEEKMYEWTDDKMRWYQEACDYPENDRNQILVELIIKELGKMHSICDIGCGIGTLSIALSKEAKHVIAIDQNSRALAALNDQIEQKGINNIEVMTGDYRRLLPKGDLPDAAVLCMAGDLGESLPHLLKWAREKIFFITSNTDYHCFKATQKEKAHESPEEIRSLIERQGLKYKEDVINIRFGQPLKNQDEAIRFMRSYDKESDLENIKAHLAQKLIKTQNKDFPLYYPCDKSYRVFIIACQQ